MLYFLTVDSLFVALFGLGPAIAWGISDFFYAKGSQKFGPLKTAFAVNSAGALVYILAYLVLLHRGATFDSVGIMYAVVGSISFGFAQTLFSKSLQIGPVSLASPISSTYPLVALGLGLLFFGAKVTPLQILGVVMIVAGVMVASGILQLKRSERRLGAGPFFALGAAIGWGVGLGFITHAMTLMSWQSVFLIEMLIAPVVLAIVILTAKTKERITLPEIARTFRSITVLGAGVMQMMGLLLLNLGLARFRESGVIIVAISSCYPSLTIFLALKHLEEKVPLVPLLGGVSGVAGVVVLTLGSG